jgi:hypothetical protein
VTSIFPWGTWKEARITVTVKDEWMVPEIGLLSPGKLYEENLEEVFLCW